MPGTPGSRPAGRPGLPRPRRAWPGRAGGAGSRLPLIVAPVIAVLVAVGLVGMHIVSWPVHMTADTSRQQAGTSVVKRVAGRPQLLSFLASHPATSASPSASPRHHAAKHSAAPRHHAAVSASGRHRR